MRFYATLCDCVRFIAVFGPWAGFWVDHQGTVAYNRREVAGKMCVVGLRCYAARASTTALTRLRLDGILLCEADSRCRDTNKSTGRTNLE